jgi:hypothetical protein
VNRMCIPLTNEFKIDIARLEIPVSGWTCLRTAIAKLAKYLRWKTRLDVDEESSGLEVMPRCRERANIIFLGNDATSRWIHTFVDVGRVGLLASLGSLLLVTSRGSLLSSLLLLSGSL